jgi:hypothetical protein
MSPTYTCSNKIFIGDVFIQNVRNACAVVDHYRMTALHAAVEAGNHDLIQILINVNVPKDEMFQNRMALHISMER